LDDEIYNAALKNALIGIKNAFTNLNWSFILKADGTVINGDENSVDPNVTKAASSFQSLAQKAGAIGGLDNMVINGEKSKVYVSCVEDMYLVAGLTKNADLVYFRTITSAVLPTVLKVLDSVASSTSALAPSSPPFKPTPPTPFSSSKPTPLPTKPLPSDLRIEKDELEADKEKESAETELTEETESTEEPLLHELGKSQTIAQTIEARTSPEDLPSQQLIVDRFGGLMVKADTVQLDADLLKRWSDQLNVEEIREVEIETFSGKTARYKVKVINDSKLEGRGLIRIPEKTCHSLEIRRGELVRVKPATLEESD
jgi:predicted regulator of Ras-like GTPase activity (Roadblock/LC7/MglB family)